MEKFGQNSSWERWDRNLSRTSRNKRNHERFRKIQKVADGKINMSYFGSSVCRVRAIQGPTCPLFVFQEESWTELIAERDWAAPQRGGERTYRGKGLGHSKNTQKDFQEQVLRFKNSRKLTAEKRYRKRCLSIMQHISLLMTGNSGPDGMSREICET